MENNITKLFAIILDRKYVKDKETGGNCKVYVLEENNTKNNDQDYIKKMFPENGNVFSSLIFIGVNSNQLQVGDLIEIPLDDISPKTEVSQSTYIKHQAIKKVGAKIIDIPFDLTSKEYLDIEMINEYYKTNPLEMDKLGKFYLSNSQYLFGPFKIEKTFIIPVIGKSVFKYDFKIDELIDIENSKYSYILEEPKKKVSEIDCMSKIQVLEHLKATLKSFQNINIEVNKVRELKEAVIKNNIGNEGLNTIRLSRANQYLSELELSYEEINKLKSNNESWELIFDKNYQKHKSEFEKEFLEDAETAKKIKDKELQSLQKEIIECEKKLTLKKQNIEEVIKEIDQINTKKEDLILSIKLSAGITDSVSKSNSNKEDTKFYLCDENLNLELPIYLDCDDYLGYLTENRIIKNEFKTYLIDSIHCLKNGNFHLANNIAFVNTLIKTFGTYKLIQQNAEIDWKKYQFIYENGFKEIVESAIENPLIPHFYVLQDINISSFECYAKPIIDIANRVRKNIPGLNLNWSSNLYFIAIPIEVEIENFGFEMQKETFKNWKAFPIIENFLSKDVFEMNSRVEINSVKIDINIAVVDHLDNYFS